jgi:hypothetical protein
VRTAAQRCARKSGLCSARRTTKFDKAVRMYCGETMAGIVTDESRNDA